MPKLIKVLLSVALCAAIAVFAGSRVWQAYEKKEAAAKSPASSNGQTGRLITVSTAQVRTAPVQENIQITGSLKPKEQVDVTSKVTGRVLKITAQVGDFVKRSQVMAELDDAELEQQVRRAHAAREVARAAVEQRKAELENAKADAGRAKQLFDQGLVARQDYETKLTNFRVMQAQVALANAQTEQAAAELRELTIQRGQMRIAAPLSGYVAQRFVDVGAVVSPATPIVRLVNLATMVTVANVPEKDVGKIRVGSRATVTVDAVGQAKFEGKVARIAPVLDVSTRTGLVEVEITNPAGLLKAEMFAHVELDVATTRHALLIPRDSLVYKGQQPGVYVLVDSKPVFRAVETGSAHGTSIEVLENLASGTTVVNRGAAMLQEGDQIRIVRTEDAELNQPRTSHPGTTAAAPGTSGV